MSDLSLRRSGMARVNAGSQVLPATHTFVHKWNEPFTPPPHFD